MNLRENSIDLSKCGWVIRRPFQVNPYNLLFLKKIKRLKIQNSD